MSKAFVSGANGFIAQHLIKLLLSHGYKVVGSVRTRSKGDHLKTLFSSGFSYVVVEDLTKEGAFDEALQSNPDISVFFHTASPVFFPDHDLENLLIKPAVEGTKSALKAVKLYGRNVHKFVLTSSFSAVGEGNPSSTITEDTWTDISLEQATSGRIAYAVSKTLAEKAAWKFMEEEAPQFAFCAVHPTSCFGPQAFDSEVRSTLNASAEDINMFLKLKKSDPLPDVSGLYYNVEDVARAHLIAAETESANNQRIVLQNGPFSGTFIAHVLRKHFPELRHSVPEVDPEKIADSLELHISVNTSRTQKLLGFEPVGLEQSIVEAASQTLKYRK